MSSDLFKEFGESEEQSWQRAQTTNVKAPIDAGDDDFGDFEEAKNHGDGARTPTTFAVEGVLSTDDPHAAPRISKSARSFYVEPNDAQPSGQHIRPATDLEIVDEWGEYEDESILFNADSMLPSRQPALSVPASKKIQVPEPEASVDAVADDDFESWEPQEEATVSGENAHDALKREIDPRSTEARKSFPRATAEPAVRTPPNGTSVIENPAVAEAPPSNIPPPSILLSISANLLSSIPSKIRNTVTADYEDLGQIQIRYICRQISMLYAIARIISGRKLRWKRDTILCQSMKIGPAGKQGGMKLTGIDKMEIGREDQEAAEVLRIWKQQIGPLRSTIGMINAHLSQQGMIVPEIAQSMPVRIGRSEEGAVTAPKACFICGLKREERVWKVDIEVQDSFGEWWFEHWGHVDCVNFWNEQKVALAQR